MSEQKFLANLMTELERLESRHKNWDDQRAAIILECRAELERIERDGGETGFAERVLAIVEGK